MRVPSQRANTFENAVAAATAGSTFVYYTLTISMTSIEAKPQVFLLFISFSLSLSLTLVLFITLGEQQKRAQTSQQNVKR